MSELKTKRNAASVAKFIAAVEDPAKRKDCQALDRLMREITGRKAEMWGGSMVGYGSYHYQYASGREGDWFLCGFAPRKQNLVVYIMAGFSKFDELMSRLGRYKTGKSCLYLRKLEDIDLDVLAELIRCSVDYLRGAYPTD